VPSYIAKLLNDNVIFEYYKLWNEEPL
jgi:hypothetical protein